MTLINSNFSEKVKTTTFTDHTWLNIQIRMFKLIYKCSKIKTNVHPTFKFKLASHPCLTNSYQKRKLVTFLPSSSFQWNILEYKRKESCINHVQNVETKSTKFSYKNNLRNLWTTKCKVLNTSCSISSSRQFSTTTVVYSSLCEAATEETVVSVAGDQYTNLLLYPDFPFIYGAEKVLHYLHELTGKFTIHLYLKPNTIFFKKGHP